MATDTDRSTLTSGEGEGRPVLGAAVVARDVLCGAGPERLWALGDGEVAAALTALGEVVGGAKALLVSVLAEAKRRSLGSGQGWGPVDWAHAMTPLLAMRELLEIDQVATAAAAQEHHLDEVVDAVTAATSNSVGDRGEALPVGKAAQICRFHAGIRGLGDPTDLGRAVTDLVGWARAGDGLTDRDLAVAIRHAGEVMRPDRLVEREAEVRRAHRSLVKGPGPVGMWRYTLVLDEEGACTLDGAVDALAKPRRDADTGELDSRTPAARRADALLDLVSRAVSAPDGVPRQAKTSLVVTIGLDALQGRCRAAGLTMDDEALTVGTVRRLACDAQVIPAVLGTGGEILDQGMARRLFDRAQIRNLWLRDRHCTFPGCSKPAAWTDAHHLVHWADGGPTDLDNAALLCRAHHSVVHTHRYGAQLTPGPSSNGSGTPRVQWDLATNSYDDALKQFRDRQRRRDRTQPCTLPATA